MEVGDLGVPTLPAAGLVVMVLRKNLDSATTLHLLMEDLIVKDNLLNPLSVTLKNVRWMEVGELGALILYAATLAVKGRRREPDSATTQPLLMAELSVQDLPIK